MKKIIIRAIFFSFLGEVLVCTAANHFSGQKKFFAFALGGAVSGLAILSRIARSNQTLNTKVEDRPPSTSDKLTFPPDSPFITLATFPPR